LTIFVISTISSYIAGVAVAQVLEAMDEESVQLAVASCLAQVNYLDTVSADYPLVEDVKSYSRRDELRAVRPFVLEAVQTNGLALRHATPELREDKNIAIEACKQNGDALGLASEDLRDTYSVARAAVRQKGQALRFASEDLQSDPELVIEAVQQDGLALEFAQDGARTDRKVVQAALQQTWKAVRFAVQVQETETMQEVVRQDWRAAEDLCNIQQPPSQEQFEEVAACNPQILQAWQLRANRGVVLAAVRADGLALRWASPELRADAEVIEEAMSSNPDALWEAHPSIRHSEAMRQLYTSGPMRTRRLRLQEGAEKRLAEEEALDLDAIENEDEEEEN